MNIEINKEEMIVKHQQELERQMINCKLEFKLWDVRYNRPIFSVMLDGFPIGEVRLNG